jgi:hypothetical protein
MELSSELSCDWMDCCCDAIELMAEAWDATVLLSELTAE